MISDDPDEEEAVALLHDTLLCFTDTIPPITNSLGQHWPQPPTRAVGINRSHAVMDSRAFDLLANYESTLPSGVYEGKMWRSGMWLLWYGSCPDKNRCSVNKRRIMISDLFTQLWVY